MNKTCYYHKVNKVKYFNNNIIKYIVLRSVQ